MAGEKLVKTGIKRDKDTLYWVGADGVYGKRRKMPGVADGKKTKVADHDVKLDYSKYLYFVDKDGDVARKERQVGGSKRKKSGKKAAPKRAAKRSTRKPAKKAKSAKKGAKKGGKKRR
jgi:hypothetical protein